MCEIVEEYAKQMVREVMLGNIKRLFENGCSLEMVLASVKDIPQDDIRNLYEEVMSTKSI